MGTGLFELLVVLYAIQDMPQKQPVSNWNNRCSVKPLAAAELWTALQLNWDQNKDAITVTMGVAGTT